LISIWEGRRYVFINTIDANTGYTADVSMDSFI
jgi:hypothetical protein